MNTLELLLIALVGVFAGFINVLAASGSMVVLPLLIFLGLEPNVANGTNRVAILVQNLVAVRNFNKQNLVSFRTNLPIIVASLLGAIVGTFTVVQIDKEILNPIIGGLLIVMFFLMLSKPSIWIKNSTNTQLHKIKSKTQFFIFFLIGFYGGFIQAGVGVFLIAALVIGIRYELIRAHAVKLLIMLIYTPLSLAIFLLYNMVDWEVAVALSLGQAIGAYIASKYARSFNMKILTAILLLMTLLSGLELVGVFDMVFS
ncbi:MAG TPA: sulfite exporter TauE/SafE family protein [Salinivirgaceae bacterium]|nr:sulfite exporter TauE/SafE family protein [Salinivirgaceae bacterium]